MKRFWLSSSLVLALLVAGAVALMPPEAVGHTPTDAVVDVLETPTAEPEIIPETEREDASDCLQCFALATECTNPATDDGKRCGSRFQNCRCGFCETTFGCFPS